MTDTGAAQSLVRRRDIPVKMRCMTGKIMIIGIGGKLIRMEICKIRLKSKRNNGEIEVGLLETLPMDGISILLGNDVSGKTTDAEPEKMPEYHAEKRQHTWRNTKNKTTAVVMRQNWRKSNGGNVAADPTLPGGRKRNREKEREGYDPTKLHPDLNLPQKELMKDQKKQTRK